MKDINIPLCPECGREAKEHTKVDRYRYKGGAYLYNARFWVCAKYHEFQTEEQLQHSLDQCKVIQEMVNEEN